MATRADGHFQIGVERSSQFVIYTDGRGYMGKISIGGEADNSALINIRNPNGSYTHLGYSNNWNYIRGAHTQIDTSTTISSGDNSHTVYGPNGTWGAYLLIGARTTSMAWDRAQIISTNGNLHLDGGYGKQMYYGYYASQDGAPNAHNFYGSATFNNNLTGNEVYTSNWFRLYGGGVHWEWYGRGIWSPESAGNSYGSIATYGGGRNGWMGYGIGSRHCVMGNNDGVGIHDNSNSWCVYFDGARRANFYNTVTINATISAHNLGGGQIWNGADGYTDNYARLPGNILLMWGSRGSPGWNAGLTVRFPIAYSSGPWTVVCTSNGGAGNVSVSSWTTTYFYADTNFGGSAKPGIWWFSMGYY